MECINQNELHDPKSKTMTHRMASGYEVILDLENEQITITKNGKIQQSIPTHDMSLADYERILSRVEQLSTAREIITKQQKKIKLHGNKRNGYSGF